MRLLHGFRILFACIHIRTPPYIYINVSCVYYFLVFFIFYYYSLCLAAAARFAHYLSRARSFIWSFFLLLLRWCCAYTKHAHILMDAAHIVYIYIYRFECARFYSCIRNEWFVGVGRAELASLFIYKYIHNVHFAFNCASFGHSNTNVNIMCGIDLGIWKNK